MSEEIRVLILGAQGTGKTSIVKVIFYNTK